MDLSQDQMDTSVFNESTTLNDTTINQTDTTISTTLSSQKQVISKNQIKVSSNYFDTNDILSMNERVPCSIEQDLFKMGYLDQSTEDEHLAKGTKLELPLWFAKEFHSEQVKLIKLESPKGSLSFI